MTPARLDTVRLQRLVRAYRESATLIAAIEIGLFTAIAKGANTLQKLTTTLDVTSINAERIVDACVALDLLIREEDTDTLRNAPDVERFLVEGTEHYAAAWMLFTRPDWDEWNRLGTHLRDKRPPVVLGGYADAFDVAAARKYHEATYSVGLGSGRRFARQVDLRTRKHVLDLGGGSGAYCIALANAYPHLTATVFDLPPVVAVAREFIEEHALSERIKTCAGDFTQDSLPTGADVIIMASNLPQYSASNIQRVVKKASDAIAPGGEFHLIGEMLVPDRNGPTDPALWALAEALVRSEGRAHSIEECMNYLSVAGFENVRHSEFIPGILTRVVGTKPTK